MINIIIKIIKLKVINGIWNSRSDRIYTYENLFFSVLTNKVALVAENCFNILKIELEKF